MSSTSASTRNLMQPTTPTNIFSTRSHISYTDSSNDLPAHIQELFDFTAAYNDPFLDQPHHQHMHNELALSTAPLTPNHAFSFCGSRDPVFNAPISAFSAHSPPALCSDMSYLQYYASDFTKGPENPHQNTPPTTPARPSSSFISSPLLAGSANRLLNGSSLFAIKTPSQLFTDTDTPPFFDSQISPVVRRSQGDVTPRYGRDGTLLSRGKDSAPRGFFRESVCAESTDAGQRSPLSFSPSLGKQNTPFLQKLHHIPTPFQPQQTPSLSSCDHPAHSLASPFTSKIRSAHFRSSESSPLSPPPDLAVSLSTPAEDGCTRPQTSSPLSEPNSHSSPPPFDLQTIFEEEDRKHRMRTRSKAALPQLDSQSRSKPTRTQKRKRSAAGEDGKENNESEIETTTPQKKKRKVLQGEDTASPALRASRWLMSRGAGPGTFSILSKKRVGKLSSSSDTDVRPVSSDAQHNSSSYSTPISQQRTFPASLPINSTFPLFYRQFPIPSFFYPDGTGPSVLAGQNNKPALPKGQVHLNIPRSAYDLYTPRFTKGVGHNKLGLCPICFEVIERGGAGHAEWLAMKFSAYKCYHMQYVHGISPTTGKPFSPPLAFRTAQRTDVRKNEKTHILEGKCHKCGKWAAAEGVKLGEAKVKELSWWKHAAACHKSSTVSGEQDVYYDDEILRRLKAYEAGLRKEDVEVDDGVESEDE